MTTTTHTVSTAEAAPELSPELAQEARDHLTSARDCFAGIVADELRSLMPLLLSVKGASEEEQERIAESLPFWFRDMLSLAAQGDGSISWAAVRAGVSRRTAGFLRGGVMPLSDALRAHVLATTPASSLSFDEDLDDHAVLAPVLAALVHVDLYEMAEEAWAGLNASFMPTESATEGAA